MLAPFSAMETGGGAVPPVAKRELKTEPFMAIETTLDCNSSSGLEDRLIDPSALLFFIGGCSIGVESVVYQRFVCAPSCTHAELRAARRDAEKAREREAAAERRGESEAEGLRERLRESEGVRRAVEERH